MKILVHTFLCLSIAAFGVSFLFPTKVHALNITAHISDQHTEVTGGDRLYFEVEIKYPENPRRKDLRIEYQIIENGRVIASEKVLRAVETQASWLDYIVVPQSTGSGIKELRIIIEDYEALHQEVAASFHVLKGKNQVEAYFFTLLGAILLVAGLVVFQIARGKRPPASHLR